MSDKNESINDCPSMIYRKPNFTFKGVEVFINNSTSSEVNLSVVKNPSIHLNIVLSDDVFDCNVRIEDIRRYIESPDSDSGEYSLLIGDDDRELAIAIKKMIESVSASIHGNKK